MYAPPNVLTISGGRGVVGTGLTLNEILASLSYALDLTTGQPMGHAQRACLIGMRVAQSIGLPDEQRSSLYPALLIKDCGCSTNAARMYEVFGGNELDAKRLSKVVDWTNLIEAARYAAMSTLPQGKLLARVARFAKVAQNTTFGHDIIDARCNRGAEIARYIGLPPEAAECIRALDEHWDGRGSPHKIAGDAIPILARIACLAQTLEVYAKTFGLATAYEVARKRSGRWFDPALVAAAISFEHDAEFWAGVYARDPADALNALRLGDVSGGLTERRIDSVCTAFAQVVDAKSPFTADHSLRVSAYAVRIAEQLGIGGERLADLRRAGLLHDIGKLAVPNSILDSPGKLSEEDWVVMKKHPYYSHEILGKISGFARIAEIAAAHHERLDGTGYYLGLGAEHLDLDMRILAVADVFDALSAERPYRGALPLETVFDILEKESGRALDASCVDAVRLSSGAALPYAPVSLPLAA